MSDSNELTPREMEVLALAWQCMESEPKIDTNKLAELTGYTPGSASVTFGKIKRKLKLKAAGSTGASTSTATPKKSATPRVPRTPKSGGKRAVTEDGAAGTPSKKGKKTSKPVNNDDDDEEFTSFSVKKEEVDDINNGANTFFEEATAYVTAGDDRL